jgi:ribosomal protein S12 methylthiotransferase accessory factor YcaO
MVTTREAPTVALAAALTEVLQEAARRRVGVRDTAGDDEQEDENG